MPSAPAAAAALARKSFQSKTRVEENRDDDNEDNLKDLTVELPPIESWDCELFLSTLVLG